MVRVDFLCSINYSMYFNLVGDSQTENKEMKVEDTKIERSVMEHTNENGKRMRQGLKISHALSICIEIIHYVVLFFKSSKLQIV